MRLLDFFLRIQLQSGTAVRQLRVIAKEADKTRRSLDRLGDAADRVAGRRPRRGTRGTPPDRGPRPPRRPREPRSITERILRGVRLSAGARLGGGLGANVSTAPLISALIAAPGPLKVFTLAVAAAAAAAMSLAELDKKRAAAAIGLKGNLEQTREQLAQLRVQQQEGLNVQGSKGQNILASVGMEDIAQLQAQLLKAGVSFKDVIQGDLLKSLALIRVADPDADIDKLVQAIANAGPVIEATRRQMIAQGDAAGAAALNTADAAFAISQLASSTKFETNEIATAIATVAPSARTLGVSMTDLTAVMALGESGFSNARTEAQGLRSILNSIFVTPKTKQVRLDEEKHKISYIKDDGTAKDLFDIREMLLRVQGEMTEQQFQQYLTQRFQKNGKQFWLAFLEQTNEAVSEAKATAGQGGERAKIAAEVSSETAGAKVAELKNSFQRFVEALREAGLGTLFNFVVDAITVLLDAFTVAINVIAEVTRPIIDMIDIVVRSFFEIIGKIGKKFYSILPQAAKDFIDTAVSTEKRFLVEGSAAKPGAKPSAKPGEKPKAGAAVSGDANVARGQVADAAREADAVKASQAAVLQTAQEIKGIADQALAQSKAFVPLLQAAQKFQEGMVLWVRAARLGVYSELLQMVANFQSLVTQFHKAGYDLGSSFNQGMQLGFANAGALPGSVTNNLTINNNGNGDAYLNRTAKRQARGVVGGFTSRANMGR